MGHKLINIDLATNSRRAWLAEVQQHPVRRFLRAYGRDIVAVALWMAAAWAAALAFGQMERVFLAFTDFDSATLCADWRC